MTAAPDPLLQAFDSQSAAYERAFAIFLAHTDQKTQARGWLDRFIDRLPERRVLIDAGAGNGAVTQWFIPRFDRTIAIEPSPYLREELSRRCPEATILSSTIQAARPELPGDLVLCSHVLYYIPEGEWLPTLDALGGMISDTGALVVATQNVDTDCMRLLEKYHHRRFDLGRLGNEFASQSPQYVVTRETVPAWITAPDQETAYAIAEFMLNLLPFSKVPRRSEVLEDLEQHRRDGAYRLSCSQDFLVVRRRT